MCIILVVVLVVEVIIVLDMLGGLIKATSSDATAVTSKIAASTDKNIQSGVHEQQQ